MATQKNNYWKEKNQIKWVKPYNHHIVRRKPNCLNELRRKSSETKKLKQLEFAG